MGIKYLSSFIKEFVLPAKIELKSGNTIYIDGNNIRFAIASTASKWSNASQFDLFHSYFSKFLEKGIKLKVYIDGCEVEEKESRKLDRLKQDIGLAAEIAKQQFVGIGGGSSPSSSSHNRRHQRQQQQQFKANLMKTVFMITLRELQEKYKQQELVEIIQTPYEADEIIAFEANKDPKCVGILSQDSDFCFMSTKFVFMNPSSVFEENGSLCFAGISRDLILMAIDQQQIPAMRLYKNTKVTTTTISYGDNMEQLLDVNSIAPSVLAPEQIAMMATLAPNDYNTDLTAFEYKFERNVVKIGNFYAALPKHDSSKYVFSSLMMYVHKIPPAKVTDTLLEIAKMYCSYQFTDAKSKLLHAYKIYKNDMENEIAVQTKGFFDASKWQNADFEKMKHLYYTGALEAAIVEIVQFRKRLFRVFGENHGIRMELVNSIKLWSPINNLCYSFILHYLLKIPDSQIQQVEERYDTYTKVNVIPFPHKEVTKAETDNHMLFILRLVSGFRIPRKNLAALLESNEYQEHEKILMVLLMTLQLLAKEQQDRDWKPEALCLIFSHPEGLESREHLGVENNIAKFERGISILNMLNQLLDFPISNQVLRSVISAVRADLYSSALSSFKRYPNEEEWRFSMKKVEAAVYQKQLPMATIATKANTVKTTSRPTSSSSRGKATIKQTKNMFSMLDDETE